MRFLNFIDNILIKSINSVSDPLDKARIKMIGYILAFYSLFSIILMTTYIYFQLHVHLVRISSIILVIIVLFTLAYYTTLWKVISHGILMVLTLGVWTNLSIYVRDVNIETIQYIWFACVLSFYMHGSKWGWFYSALTILPVVAFTISSDKNYFFIGGSSHLVSQPIYVFITSYNFLAITFLQFYFFRSFNKNIKSLHKAKSELKILNEKLNITLSDVEKLSNSRIEFLSTMSHEIRTPLNGVIGITNVLLMGNPRKDQEENLDLLKFSAENLLLLVNNVLDVNKLDSDKTELEQIDFDLAMLLKNAYSSSKLRASEKALDFKLFIDPVLENKLVISDPTRLTQVILNLINNAIKFTEKGSVSMSAHSISLSEKTIKVQFIVEDTGIGILPEKQNLVFEPFTQATASTNRNFGGTGLGLPIVKKILRMFDSKITLTSEENVGSKFSFDIDFNYIELEEPKLKTTAIIAQNDLAGLKVLIAEDNRINMMIVEKILKNWNIVPVGVENGLSAVQMLKKEDFDVILMDLHMPIMDGYEATAEIRKLDDLIKANVPIIALTASVNEKVAKEVISSKMNDYLPKPFNPEHLFNKLKDIAENKLKI